MTDGVSISVVFESTVRGMTNDEARQAKRKGVPKEAAVLGFKPEDEKKGVDPGRKNIMTTFEELKDGTSLVKSFTRDAYYRLGGIDQIGATREARATALASDALAALSNERRRTSDAAEFASYFKACGVHSAELSLAYSCRKAASESFSLHRFKTKALDGFLSRMGSHPVDEGGVRKGTLYIGYGNAKFDSSGRRERAVPTSKVELRMDTAFKHRLVRVPTDEYNTTQKCCKCHEQLRVAYRPKIFANGTQGYIVDRDVRFCTSEQCMESHPCPAAPHLLDGLTIPRCKHVAVCRDGNSSCSMLKPHHVPTRSWNCYRIDAPDCLA